MMTFWRYELELALMQRITMPIGAKIVHVAAQFEKPCIWVMCDPNAEKVPRAVGIIPTGEGGFDENLVDYRGTFMLQGGTFVGHVVEPKA